MKSIGISYDSHDHYSNCIKDTMSSGHYCYLRTTDIFSFVVVSFFFLLITKVGSSKAINKIKVDRSTHLVIFSQIVSLIASLRGKSEIKKMKIEKKQRKRNDRRKIA